MVQAPPDWSPPGSQTPADAPAEAAATAGTSGAAAATAEPAGLSPTTAAEAATLRDRWADAANVPPPPPPSPEEVAAAAADVPLRGEDWLTPRQRWMRRYLPKIAAGVAGVSVTVALWYAFAPGDAPTDETPDSVAAVEAADDADSESPETPPIDEGAADIETEMDASVIRAPEPDDPTEPPALVRRDVPIAAPRPPEPVDEPPKSDDPDGTDGSDDPATARAVVADPPAYLERDPLPPIDVAARMNDKILKLDYVRTPLIDFLGVLSSISTIPITLDADALAEEGIRPQTPISVRKSNVTVREALELALARPKLRYLVVDDQVVVTTSDAAGAALPVRREVGDLVGGDAKAVEPLAMVIQRLVEPLSWRTRKTTTSLRADGTALVIANSPRIVRKIDAFLAALRAARSDPLGVAATPPPVLEMRYASAQRALSTVVTLNYTAPTPLVKIVDRLAESSKMTVLVDWRAVARENVGPATLARMSATAVSVEAALAALVDPLDLAFRVIDESTVEITTRDELAGKLELAAFPLADVALADTARNAANYSAALDRFRAQFGPAIGEPTAADGNDEVAWYLDAPSKTVFLLAPQDVHAAIEDELRSLRSPQRP